MSSLLDRKHKIHPSSSYFLVFFVPALHHIYCFKLCTTGYCSVSALHHVYSSHLLPCSFSLQVLWDNLNVLQCDSDSFSMYGIEVWRYYFLVSALNPGYCFHCFFCSFFHDIYCKAIQMFSGRMVILLVCRDDMESISSVFSLCFFSKKQYIITLLFSISFLHHLCLCLSFLSIT